MILKWALAYPLNIRILKAINSENCRFKRNEKFINRFIKNQKMKKQKIIIKPLSSRCISILHL